MRSRTIQSQAQDLIVEAGRDYDRMARDPLFRAYGGVVTSTTRAAYVRRRIDEFLAWNRHNEPFLAVVRAAAEMVRQ